MTGEAPTTSVAEVRPIRERRATLSSRLSVPLVAVGALTVVALALRWPTIAGPSYWYDEWVSKEIVQQHSLVEMLKSVQQTESTPPLYYLLGWAWAHVFGSGEFALRSLSALFGAATVLVAYAVGVVLVSRRVGIIAAAFVATNPLLVWYSTEARSYALLVLLGALTFLFVVRSLAQPGKRNLALWSVTASLALATHYFAVFLVAAEVLVLVFRRPGYWRRIALAVAPAVATGVALLPLAYSQRDNAAWVARLPLKPRVREIPRTFVGGVTAASPWLELAAGALAVAGLLLLARTDHRERRAAGIALGVGGAAVVLPVMMALIRGSLIRDYVLARNVIAGLVPLSLAIAVGCGSRRATLVGPIVAATLCAVWIGALAAVASDARLQRADWETAARLLGKAKRERVVVAWGTSRLVPLADELAEERLLKPGETVRVTELDVLGFDRPLGIAWWSGSARNMLDVHPRRDIAPAGFAYVRTQKARLFEVLRFRSRRRIRLTWRELRDIDLRYGHPSIFVERPSTGS